MKIERETHPLEAWRADLAGSTFRIASSNLDGMTVDGLSVTELLEYWRAGHAAKNA
jgi:hypothetical protein